MSSLRKEQLISAFKQLGKYLNQPDEAFKSAVYSAKNANAWFTEDEVNKSVKALAEMLNEADLEQWFENIEVTTAPKKVGLILAGNIPLVGFHDVMCVLATGNIAQIKLSSSDNKLLPFLLNQLCEILPELKNHIIYAEQLKGFDAVIATGSNNTSRYFEYYFGKVPNIIRRNRNSVAVLTGEEKEEEIAELGHDILDYFGMGCRSISKIYIPENYEIKNFFEPLEQYQDIINHFKYNNNYDYNKSIYLVNQQKHYDNGFLLLKEDEGLSSPLAVLYYETYENIGDVTEKLKQQREQIQCVVGNLIDKDLQVLRFGESQHPKLWDYADNVDTIEFLKGLGD
ncbi:acyl-CoA reductase [Pedobacter xixiisoli]|uniref:Acyl-CoA reductase (LuxC) n=1 Tax=Pedobacter xixiisoli TaxID=1476464 RepID=A0A285ZYU5_9SPHI|nr:acyl-CoA reductase [Pedobacter xixiisoli]SOD14828.1 Acyl-CoA reductase (LuxC) [Pedobacter xixiisoli]